MSPAATSVHSPFRLDGQTAIVTGAGAGIGRGIAWVFARAGASVVSIDQNSASAEETRARIEAAGGRAMAAAADVTDAAAAVAILDAVMERFGRLDILVNNAGVYPRGQPLPELARETFVRTLEINVTAAFQYICEAASRMKPGGCIINISSIESLRTAGPGIAQYCTSKAALNALTRSAAVDLAPKGIRVNAILPGIVRTEGTRASLATDAMGQLTQRIPSGRIGEPEDIAHAALFLASGAAAYVNGHCLTVDGGMTIAG